MKMHLKLLSEKLNKNYKYHIITQTKNSFNMLFKKNHKKLNLIHFIGTKHIYIYICKS